MYFYLFLFFFLNPPFIIYFSFPLVFILVHLVHGNNKLVEVDI